MRLSILKRNEVNVCGFYIKSALYIKMVLFGKLAVTWLLTEGENTKKSICVLWNKMTCAFLVSLPICIWKRAFLWLHLRPSLRVGDGIWMALWRVSTNFWRNEDLAQCCDCCERASCQCMWHFWGLTQTTQNLRVAQESPSIEYVGADREITHSSTTLRLPSGLFLTWVPLVIKDRAVGYPSWWVRHPCLTSKEEL